MLNTSFSLKPHFFFFLLFLLFSLSFFPQSTYAACIVDGTSFNTNSADIGIPITLDDIKEWDTDGDDVSTAELIRRIAAALGRSSRLLPVPAALLRMGLRMLGKGDEAERLLGSLCLRVEHLSAAGWRPAHSMAQGLAETVAGRYAGSRDQDRSTA